MANALTSVPSTGKCSSDKSGATSRCARIAASTLRATSVVSSRSRFFVNTAGLRPGAPRSGLKSVRWTDIRAPFTPHRVIDAQPDEPTEHKVILHLFHRLPFGSDRKQDLDQTGAQLPLGRDRRSPLGRTEHLEVAVQAGKRIVDDLPDLAQRMPGRDAILKIDLAEKRPARLVRAPHRIPPLNQLESGSSSSSDVQGLVFQQPANGREVEDLADLLARH